MPLNWSIQDHAQSGGQIRYEMNPLRYKKFCDSWIDDCGATIIGGCCGIGPNYIRELSMEQDLSFFYINFVME